MKEWYKIAVPSLMIIVSVIAAIIYLWALVYNKRTLRLQKSNWESAIKLKRKSYLTRMINTHFTNVYLIEKEYLESKGTKSKVTVEEKFGRVYESFHKTILSADAVEYIFVAESDLKKGFIQISKIDYEGADSENMLKLRKLLGKYNNWIATRAFNGDALLGNLINELTGLPTFGGMDFNELESMVGVKQQPLLIKKIVRYMKIKKIPKSNN